MVLVDFHGERLEEEQLLQRDDEVLALIECALREKIVVEKADALPDFELEDAHAQVAPQILEVVRVLLREAGVVRAGDNEVNVRAGRAQAVILHRHAPDQERRGGEGEVEFRQVDVHAFIIRRTPRAGCRIEKNCLLRPLHTYTTQPRNSRRLIHSGRAGSLVQRRSSFSRLGRSPREAGRRM